MKQITADLWVIDEIGDAVHCYMWEWPGGLTLIDSGTPRNGKTILRALVDHGYPLHNVRRIIVTHADLDHAGGLSVIKKATGASVLCHAVEKEYLERPGPRRLSSPLLRIPFTALAWIPGFRQKPVIPDELVVDGQTLPEGFMVIHTPGHSPGHICLLHPEKRLLIAGDALSNRRGVLSGSIPLLTSDKTSAQRSVLKLAKKYGDDYETIVFGHGPPIMTNGGKRVRALASQIFSEEV